MKKVKVKSEAQYGGKVKYNLKPPCMKAEAQDEDIQSKAFQNSVLTDRTVSELH